MVLLLVGLLSQFTFSAQVITNGPNCPKLKFTTEQCCFTPGSVITFNWEGGCTNSQLNLYLRDSSTYIDILTISTGIPNTGHFTWNVPNNVPIGNFVLYIEDPGLNSWDYSAFMSIQKDCNQDDKCECNPDIDFSIKEDGCSASFNVNTKGECKIEKVLWDFGDNSISDLINPTHDYSQNGTFNVCLTITYSDKPSGKICIEKLCKIINIETCLKCCPITPTFTYDINECKVNFTSLNQNNECSKIIEWSWDFDDGSPPSTQTNPSHSYNQNGTYNVCLKATIQTNDGLIFHSIVCRDVIIEDCIFTGDCCPIKTIFNYEIDSDDPCDIVFNGSVSPDSCSNKVEWSWNFGDGNSSNLQNPNHDYHSDGNYLVCLWVKHQSNNSGTCIDSSCQTIQIVNCIDTSDCNIYGVTLSQTNITCNNNSGGSVVVQGGNGTSPYSYTLNGNTQTSGAFSNLTIGSHTIQISDANNCNSSVDIIITSESVEQVSVSGDEKICSGGVAQLLASPSGSFQWNPAASLSCSTCPNPIANPTNTTTYTVNHIDQNGCQSSDQITVSVGDSFVLNIPDLVVCPGESVFLNPNAMAANYLWQPQSGLSCTNCSNPESTLTQQTTYTVTAIDGNCIGTDQVTVSMHPSSGVNFTWQVQSSDQSVDFMANPSGLSSYSWDFGDPNSGTNNTGTVDSVNHIFSIPNQNYTVCLTVTDDCGPFRICNQIFVDADCNYKDQIHK